MLLQQRVSVEVEITDQGNAASSIMQTSANFGHGHGISLIEYSQSHQLAAFMMERENLLNCRIDV
jgi:hypothetical protein